MNTTAIATRVADGPLLLDFDGPICAVFAGYLAAQVAAELVTLLKTKMPPLPAEIRDEQDPLTVLRWVGQTCSHDLPVVVEKALCAAELAPANPARPS